MRRSSRRWSSAGTPSVVLASLGWGTTRPSGPTPSRATRSQACSRTWARRARRPVRGQASAWSPNRSSGPPHPCWLGAPPHRAAVTGRGCAETPAATRCARGVGASCGPARWEWPLATLRRGVQPGNGAGLGLAGTMASRSRKEV